MSVRAIGRVKQGTRTRGRFFTATRRTRRTRRPISGRIFTGMLASAGVAVGVFLSPTYLLPIGMMAFFVVIGGWVADEIGQSKHLWARLVGPSLALVGLVLVVYLLVVGGL